MRVASFTPNIQEKCNQFITFWMAQNGNHSNQPLYHFFDTLSTAASMGYHLTIQYGNMMNQHTCGI